MQFSHKINKLMFVSADSDKNDVNEDELDMMHQTLNGQESKVPGGNENNNLP